MFKPNLPVAGGARRASGFTLIELLVVMGIIGVLMALLFPAIDAAKRYALRVELMELIKELGSACRLYKQDHLVYPWYPYPSKGLEDYDPDARGLGARSQDIIRILAPDNQELKNSGVTPQNTKNYVTIPNKFIRVPGTGPLAASGNPTAVDIWDYEFKFLTDPDTLVPIVYSRGKDAEALLEPDGDDTLDDFLWDDLNGDGTWSPDERAGDGYHGDDVGVLK